MATTTKTAPAKAKREIIARRKAGETLAELRKAFPGVDVRAVLDQADVKAPERKVRGATVKAQPATATTGEPEPTKTGEPTGYSGSGATTQQPPKEPKARTRSAKQAEAEKPKAKKAQAPKAAPDPKLAAKVVTMRDKQGMSWLKIGAALKLSDSAQPKAGASRARTLYRSVKGQDADTGPLAKQ